MAPPEAPRPSRTTSRGTAAFLLRRHLRRLGRPGQAIACRRPGQARQELPELCRVASETCVVSQAVGERQPHPGGIGIHLPGVQVDDGRDPPGIAAGGLLQKDPGRESPPPPSPPAKPTLPGAPPPP